MATAASGKGRNEPPPRPIIVKKIVAPAEHGHHGGAWKVAYADFVTAMMAFFMLMWLLSITDQQKRKGLAEYFSQSVMDLKKDSAGADGILGGSSIDAGRRVDSGAPSPIPLPAAMGQATDAGAGEDRAADRQRFEQLKKALNAKMEATPALKKLKRHVRFTETREGLRIDLVDEADFSMFALGTDRLVPQAMALVREVAGVIDGVPNEVIVRGHTDALRYAAGGTMNNWMLSTARAEATRSAMAGSGLDEPRFARIEGVAEREPFNPKDLYDARNRRMSITLAWSKGQPKPPGTSKGD